MSRVDTVCKIPTYPDHDDEKSEVMSISSHWNYGDRVHIVIGKKEVIVFAADLIYAINNCTR